MKTLGFVFSLLITWGFAQDYSGTFVQQDDSSTIISFQSQNEGYVGSLINGGTDEFSLEALPQEDYLIGLLRGEAIGYEDMFFVAQFLQDGSLGLSVAPLNAEGNPIESEAVVYGFIRQSEQIAPSIPATNPLASPTTPSMNPLGSQQDSFSGEYQGQAFNLQLQKTASGYSGAVLLEGQSYPLEAQASGSRLSGYFVADNQQFSFQGELLGTELRIVSDGEVYVLTKLAALPSNTAPQNPLGTNSSPTNTPTTAAPQGTTVITAGQQYPAGTVLFSPSTGASFTVPANHVAFFDPDWEVFALRSQDGSSILVVEAASHASAETLSVFAAEALAMALSSKEDKESLEIELVQGPVPVGDLLTANVFIEGSLISVATKEGAFGNSAVVFAYGPQADQVVQNLGQSFQFTQPDSQVQQWQQQLAGHRLSAGSSVSGYESNSSTGSVSIAGRASYVYDFCAGGRFQYEFDDRTNASVGGAEHLVGTIELGDAGSYLGDWHLVSSLIGIPILVLEDDDGELVTHFVEETEQGAWFDGRNFEASQSPLCG